MTLRFRAQWPLHKAKQLKTKMEKPLKDFSSKGVPLEHYGRNEEFYYFASSNFNTTLVLVVLRIGLKPTFIKKSPV
jgi:hypothetical protein